MGWLFGAWASVEIFGDFTFIVSKQSNKTETIKKSPIKILTFSYIYVNAFKSAKA